MKTTDNETKQEITWGGWLNEFLWICAGVNRKVLRQCPTEYAKHAGIGGTILFTAVLATLSGGYALYTVFGNQYIAIVFGLTWGVMIFNLDRFIVNTMYSDGKVTISWMEFFCGLPRIVMAIFLGIVISTPLELKIFEDAIDIRIEQDKDKLVQDKIQKYVQTRDSIAEKRDGVLSGNSIQIFDSNITTASETTNRLLAERKKIEGLLTTIQHDIEQLNSQINSISRQLSSISEQNPQYNNLNKKRSTLIQQRNAKKAESNKLISEINTTNGQIAASDTELGKLLTAKKEENKNEAIRMKNEVDSINLLISNINVRHKDWSEDIIKEKGSYRDKLDVNYKGFQAKMHAFSELKSEEDSTWLSALFIMLLFVTIETAPTFFKMMTAYGPYDDLLRAEMHAAKVYADKKISDINDEINTAVRISTEHNQNRLAAETLANKQLLEKVAAAQAEILEEAIELWRQQELEKIRSNPAEYIQTGTTPVPQPSTPQT